MRGLPRKEMPAVEIAPPEVILYKNFHSKDNKKSIGNLFPLGEILLYICSEKV